jgi:probable rRNA maturation factor
LKDELTLLTIHGVLHLLGHDHAGDDEKERMWSAQQALLDELGLSITPPHG